MDSNYFDLHGNRYDFEGFAVDNAHGCMRLPPYDEIFNELKLETLNCCTKALAKIMADHTQLDWRDTVATITDVPSVVMIGKKSQCFPWQGVETVATLMKDNEHCYPIYFEARILAHVNYSHMLKPCIENIIKNLTHV